MATLRDVGTIRASVGGERVNALPPTFDLAKTDAGMQLLRVSCNSWGHGSINSQPRGTEFVVLVSSKPSRDRYEITASSARR